VAGLHGRRTKKLALSPGIQYHNVGLAMIRILFIDDDPQAQNILSTVLHDRHTVVSALTAAEGMDLLARADPDVVLLDISLPDRSGLDLLDEIVQRPVAPPVIMLTAFGEVEFVKRAVLAGAYDYILKPYTLDHLEGTIRRAVENAALRRAYLQGLRNGVNADPWAASNLVGESRALKELRALIGRFATGDSPVLIQGESGTGKELAAEAIHRLSPRKDGPFEAINCGAIPENLVEAELFGSEKGAFTDATSRAGCFERADGGTILLDEIGELPPKAQTTLLRVIEFKRVHRVGGTRAIPLNIRILSATNRDLKQEVRAGRFREDLYYRINVLFLQVPPLRDRDGDIAVLCAYFLKAKRTDLRIHPRALEKLLSHSWPGNVRELRNVIERAAVLSEGDEIQARDIQFY
jgi:DNA-binding NtrC family response regulator